MKRHIAFVLFLFWLFAGTAAAETRVIVRDTLGLPSLQNLCSLVGCNVVEGIDGSLGQLFLVTAPDILSPDLLVRILDSLPGVLDAETDQLLNLQQCPGTDIPAGLYDSTPVNYYGTTVWHGYVDQPAAQIIRLEDAQSAFNASGAGIVAVIDTGIDPNHPAFANVLVPGYDFTRNSAGGSEDNDVPEWDHSGQSQPAHVSQSTMAVVDGNNATTLNGPQYADFGHGTMVAGVIHLVAPEAKIMALKAFYPDGSGYLSDILRATYYAVQHNAKVINMSFDFPSYSEEMWIAVHYAEALGVICAAAVGNDGENEIVYPAGYTQPVMGIASTSDSDSLSSFSNYGKDVWVASPGEAIITTYPFGTYAAGWGTSFSTPFVTGGAALLVGLRQSVDQSQAANALSHAAWVSSEAGYGRIDLYEALSSFESQ
jgi:subtilisin family serine protease